MFVYHQTERILVDPICETSQIFVWRNKAFIFFQKSDIKAGDHLPDRVQQDSSNACWVKVRRFLSTIGENNPGLNKVTAD